MGLVFLAEHTRVGRKVTLKILAPEFASADVALPAVTLSTRVVGLGRLELPTSPLSVVTGRSATICDSVLRPAIDAASGAVGVVTTRCQLRPILI